MLVVEEIERWQATLWSESDDDDDDNSDAFDDDDDTKGESTEAASHVERVCAMIRPCVVAEKWGAVALYLEALREAVVLYARSGQRGLPAVYVDTMLELMETFEYVSVAPSSDVPTLDDDDVRARLEDTLVLLLEANALPAPDENVGDRVWVDGDRWSDCESDSAASVWSVVDGSDDEYETVGSTGHAGPPWLAELQHRAKSLLTTTINAEPHQCQIEVNGDHSHPGRLPWLAEFEQKMQTTTEDRSGVPAGDPIHRACEVSPSDSNTSSQVSPPWQAEIECADTFDVVRPDQPPPWLAELIERTRGRRSQEPPAWLQARELEQREKQRERWLSGLRRLQAARFTPAGRECLVEVCRRARAANTKRSVSSSSGWSVPELVRLADLTLSHCLTTSDDVSSRSTDSSIW